MKVASSRLLLLSLLAGIHAPGHAALSNESPFMPRGGAQAVVATENSPIEFRGVIATPAGLTFGIYEPGTQKGTWVTQGEKTSAFVVRSYDAERSAVMVEYQGQVQTLVLKEAKFDGTVAPTSAPPVAGMPPIRPPSAGNPQPSMNQADEAKRLETVAAEVRRRRAARAAASQPGSPPMPAQAQPGR